jgi:predicted CopG family antitoxin
MFKYNICTCICMPSRNIAVQQAVYDALNREKRVGESFTELFRRLLDQRGGLSELIGHWDAAGQRGDRAALRALRTGGARSR